MTRSIKLNNSLIRCAFCHGLLMLMFSLFDMSHTTLKKRKKKARDLQIVLNHHCHSQYGGFVWGNGLHLNHDGPGSHRNTLENLDTSKIQSRNNPPRGIPQIHQLTDHSPWFLFWWIENGCSWQFNLSEENNTTLCNKETEHMFFCWMAWSKGT